MYFQEKCNFPTTPNKGNAPDANNGVPLSSASVRMSWARLLKRVFDIDIDIEHCLHCGGILKIISAILNPASACLSERRLEHQRKSLILSNLSDSKFATFNPLHNWAEYSLCAPLA
ncbi:hypothetical protein [Nitrosomonas sp. Is37]|uniref:hypothetical protein n=1 Tax=Nitrosomonas sp. Is37 TaxID=3080535 RepID=UPI00294B1978|nr:hypothetical protein [Nitrosomonas sp. Is37]MDV6344300.1 hypothetical protein [Nitrosomonas sp. Is37]